ncbi:metallopeptidase TldD-related protein [Streptomyces sp. NPDC006285]|uniref:metallopeptidase TldD-related protein n=1 Tax=Streptomyces sp. NPDC006285 TaxID=3364742 RepID=UPI00367952DA
MTGSSSPYELVERALALSTARDCIVIADEFSSVNLRWAQNTLTTNGANRDRKLTVIAAVDGQSGPCLGVVSRSGVTNNDLEPLVRAAEQAAQAAGPAEDAQPLVTGSPHSSHFTDEPADTSSDVLTDLAPSLGTIFARAKLQDRHLYGYAAHSMTSSYLGTSAGLRLRHDQPCGTVQMNAKSADHGKSAWTGRSTRDFTDLDLLDLEEELDTRLRWAHRKVDLPAGRYETLLPPSAVADLLIYQMWCASARAAVEGRSAFSAPAGGTLLGERISSLPLTLFSDPQAPGLECSPFSLAHTPGDDVDAFDNNASVFDNGLPLQRTEWISQGKLHRLLATRHGAQVTGLPAAPSIGNLILDGTADRSLAQMVASTRHGLLLTCIWYIRELDPASLLLTGLTRDGVYLIENGEITAEVNNFRFNESPLDLLRRATEASSSQRTLPREWCDWFTRAAAPALRIPDFNMSSISQGV